MRRHIIQPYGFNILHYLANENNDTCIIEALKSDVPYIRDKLNQSPLEYALNRNSRQAASVLLDHVINSDELSTKMEPEEICKLISSSSATLSEFFENAI